MYTKAAAWASSATPIPMCNAVGFRMALKQILKQMWYLISVTVTERSERLTLKGNFGA
jgi:hypothetical protein